MVRVAPERVAGDYLYRTQESFQFNADLGHLRVTVSVSERLVINRSECSLLGDRLHSLSF